MEKFDVVAIGELLIDFTENGYSNQGHPILEVNPGGAPCNFLAMLTKLGLKTAFIGKVGDDQFGKFLKQKVASQGIETKYITTDKNVNTTLAFVHTMQDGDREFSFYRNPGADMMLSESDIDVDIIENAKVFHFGTLSMTHQSCLEATKKAIAIAKKSDCIISFDPNLRIPLWDNLEQAKIQFDYGMTNCDILKISDNELLWFTGANNYSSGIKMLQDKYNISLITLSMGKDGSQAYYKDIMIEIPGFLNEKTVETTGAGDCFAACVVGHMLNSNFNCNEKSLREMLIFANAAASIVTTKKGALAAMPERETVLNYILNYN